MNTSATTKFVHPDNFSNEDLRPAIDILKQDGVIVYPTETVYGLGARITSEKAVDRLFEIKGREAAKAVSILIAELTDLNIWCGALSDAAIRLIAQFWPGPLTLVLPASQNLPDYLQQNNKVGVRFPAHQLSRSLARILGEPITSTSANRSGLPPALSGVRAQGDLGKDVDYIINCGACQGGIPSTVVDANNGEPKLLRAGAIEFHEIIKCVKGETHV